MSRECKSCMFWDNKGDGTGLCRRHAPRAMFARPMFDENKEHCTYLPILPLTDQDEWCGEYVSDD